MGAVSRNHGLECDWSGKGEKGSEACPLQTAGLVPGVFLLSQPSPRNSIAIAIAIAALLRPCLCRTSKHSTAYLSIPSTHRDSGIQKRTRFVGAGRSLTTDLPWKAVIATSLPLFVLSSRLSKPKKKNKQTSKQAVVVGQ